MIFISTFALRGQIWGGLMDGDSNGVSVFPPRIPDNDFADEDYLFDKRFSGDDTTQVYWAPDEHDLKPLDMYCKAKLSDGILNIRIVLINKSFELYQLQTDLWGIHGLEHDVPYFNPMSMFNEIELIYKNKKYNLEMNTWQTFKKLPKFVMMGWKDDFEINMDIDFNKYNKELNLKELDSLEVMMKYDKFQKMCYWAKAIGDKKFDGHYLSASDSLPQFTVFKRKIEYKGAKSILYNTNTNGASITKKDCYILQSGFSRIVKRKIKINNLTK
jgi:hypothetical protein